MVRTAATTAAARRIHDHARLARAVLTTIPSRHAHRPRARAPITVVRAAARDICGTNARVHLDASARARTARAARHRARDASTARPAVAIRTVVFDGRRDVVINLDVPYTRVLSAHARRRAWL